MKSDLTFTAAAALLAMAVSTYTSARLLQRLREIEQEDAVCRPNLSEAFDAGQRVGHAAATRACGTPPDLAVVSVRDVLDRALTEHDRGRQTPVANVIPLPWSSRRDSGWLSQAP